MKKIIVTSVVTLGLAVASIAGASFDSNLSVGSTGAKVSELQTWLISKGFSIPSIASGAAQTGYFGMQTKAAVIAYQAANGIPNTGFVGPLTRASLNATGGVAVNPGFVCPVGMTCTVNPGTVVPGTPSTPGTISTPGVAGSLDIANGSIVGNGTSVNDGQGVDLGSISLQSGASDMAVTSASVDFNVRPWLYMTSLSIRDQSGKVLATVDNLNQAMFSEITVGSDYRISIPVNMVIPKATKIYAVLHGTFGSSNRGAQNIALTRVQVRSIDGTGVTLTADTGVLAATVMYVAYNGQQGSSIIVTTDPSSPKAGNIIQTSTGNTQTKDVLLGVFDLKSQNIQSTLQGLSVNLNMNGVGSIGSTFAYITLKSGSTVLNTGTAATPTASTSVVTFSNFNLVLPANQYIPVSVFATVNGAVNGITASTSLVALAANITGIDSSSNALTVQSSGTIPGGGVQTLSLSGSALSSLSWTINPTSQGGNANKYPAQTLFTGYFTVAAGNNPLFLSTTGATALTIATTTTPGTNIAASVSAFVPTDGTQSWDTASAYQITAGTSRTFKVVGSLALNSSVASTTAYLSSVGVTSVKLSSTAAGVGSADLPISTQLQGLNSDLSSAVYLNGII